jgi:hypothetical protein
MTDIVIVEDDSFRFQRPEPKSAAAPRVHGMTDIVIVEDDSCRFQRPISVEANARAARVKAAAAGGRSQNRRTLRGFAV